MGSMLDCRTNSNGLIMRLPLQLLVLAGLLLSLAACGKKGQLYLPDAPAQPQHTQSDK